MAAPYIMPAGTKIYYTNKASQIAPPPATPDALPSTYPLAGGDVGTDPEVTWVEFGCVKSATGFAQLSPELTDHRCLASPGGVIEKLPTGFFTPSTVTMKVSFDQAEYTFFDSLVTDRGVVRILVVFPTRSDHTLPFRMAHRYYVTQAQPNFDSFTEEIGTDLSFELAFDSGVKTLGS